MRGWRHWTGVLLGTAQLLAAQEPQPPFVPAAGKSILQADAIREASGLAASTRDDGFLWVVNDSGAEPAVHLIEESGNYRGKVTLKQARNIDWEDLASFTLDGKSFLLAADTGDNEARRDTCTLYVLREPALPEPGGELAVSVTAERRIDFRYEGGPRDCEAVAVDVAAGKILLLSKRTNPPEVHELPLMPPEKRGVLVTRKTGLTRMSAPSDSMVPFRDQPTGLDIAPDHSLAAVVTYYGVFLFPRKAEESWQDAFTRKPVTLAPHVLAQAESVAFSKDGHSIIVVSEGRSSKIVRYRKRL